MALPSHEFVIAEVDREFHLQHPEAPEHLDPNDPAQAELVQQWNAMYHEFLSATVDSHFFRFFPHAPRQLDPNDPDQAQLVEYWTDLRDAIVTGTSRYDWSTPPQTNENTAAGDTGAHTDGSGQAVAAGGAAPDVDVHMDQSQFLEFVHLCLEGAHIIGDTAEVLGNLSLAAGASEEAAVVLLGEALGPVGMIASTIIMGWEVVNAFGTGERLQEQQGFCYGVMWQVCGLPDQAKGFIDWAPNTADELKEAFYSGVAEGRQKASDPAVHNRAMLAIAYYQAHGSDLDWSRHYVLNDLWHHVRESGLGNEFITWPDPEDMQPL
ncbi:hypothetical protein EV385_5659 [Krasilnikovia cinnamomea]|uniref:Uncharacterized protein n=1 Tax=Krasilnikovia cinnamomea TaxID=349313 RepID=A0A4V2G7S7_9ACTN|nr:hypothetical protein [Krasilnikovia cinnamomea]RZU53726.1 hypothetical protein EV385_5659 [Krasilnikovia cinnamomea]